MTREPIRYDASLEHAENDEAATAAAIDLTMAKIREQTFADGGHAIRSVHAKAHGFLVGELVVESGLPRELAQGLFAREGAYPVLLRLSATPGDVLDDSISTPRGMALKILGVPGERLPGSETHATQNFLLVDGPAFNAPTLKKFLSGLKQLAATTDKAEGAKKAVSATLQVAEKVVEAFGAKSAKLTSMGGHPKTHPLGETYFSQAPVRWGDHVAKVSVAPVSPALLALKDAPVDLDGRPDGLRDAVVAFFREHGGEWQLRAQLCTDAEAMPVEDASVEWPEAQSPYRAVATIRVGSQTAWSPARAALVDDGMVFSPWHGLAAHRPLGAVMRARQAAYAHSAQFRAARNGKPVAEPTSLDAVAAAR